MSTFAELQARINTDYLNRNFGAETQRAIQAAVRHYERRRWEFNETSTALTTSAGDSFLSLPSNFLILDDLRITVNNEDLSLIPRDASFIRDVNMTGITGQPTDYSRYARRIELAITPDSAYSVPIYYVKSLPTLSADGDTNAWLEGGMQDVIAYHATKLVWGLIIRNDKEAFKFDAMEKQALSIIDSSNEQNRTPGHIKPTRF